MSVPEFITGSEAQTIGLAEALAGRLRGGDVVALIGPLGSGKTQFVRGLARGLGLGDRAVSSPTFLICQEYRAAPGQAALSLAHVDAYRLRGSEELDAIGWDELLNQSDMVIAVEWADRIEAELPPNTIVLEFEHLGPTSRRITIIDAGGDVERLAALEAIAPRAATNTCPICSSPVSAEAATFPFCTQRCRLVDLGQWFSGTRVFSRPLGQEDFDQL